MIKLQIHYTTLGGVKKSKTYSYMNPASTDVVLKDFANALNDLTTNTAGDIYKIDTALLLNDDSDDIVTPIVTTGKQDPQLALSTYSLYAPTAGTHTFVVDATYLGDGILSAQIVDDSRYKYSANINGKQITFTKMGLEPGDGSGTDTFIVSVSETDSYYSDSAVIQCAYYGQSGGFEQEPDMPDVSDAPIDPIDEP